MWNKEVSNNTTTYTSNTENSSGLTKIEFTIYDGNKAHVIISGNNQEVLKLIHADSMMAYTRHAIVNPTIINGAVSLNTVGHQAVRLVANAYQFDNSIPLDEINTSLYYAGDNNALSIIRAQQTSSLLSFNI